MVFPFSFFFFFISLYFLLAIMSNVAKKDQVTLAAPFSRVEDTSPVANENVASSTQVVDVEFDRGVLN